MEQDLVRFSRAGDAFHYRWAARRCLKLLDPVGELDGIYIEGSGESELGGECSIDLAEYLKDGGIRYFQLKHTTTQGESPFLFTHLKNTLKQFLERFSENQNETVQFHFVTNRPVSSQFKNAVLLIAAGKGNDTSYLGKLQKLTSLGTEGIASFCRQFTISDTEGDFRQQKTRLRMESSPYFTSSAESIELDSLIALINDRALPVLAGQEPEVITKEDVLSQFQISSEKVLFPASPKFDAVTQPQKREFHQELVGLILEDDLPLVIRAPGGVGKTVVAQQLKQDLPHPHRSVVYDCFGNGSYRNPSEPRHPSKVALVQIANELAGDGLCSPLIPRPHDGDQTVFAAFKDRLTQAITILRQPDPSARLILFIDAADNSEMAAEEMNEKGFSKLLLRESLPVGCKVVAFSRPGKMRADLLQPPASCHYYDLPPFTPNESLLHLRTHFPSATSAEGEEFHKLSQGNPRVQAFALDEEITDLNRLLTWLGPNHLTVEDIIRGQLGTAIARLRENCPKVTESQITSVCRCLATLPPCIPKEVLASAARLDASDIESFVADLGRPLWISENLVYFRDEPTESWFRDTFAADTAQVAEMVEELIPFAGTSTYVARALPSLLHRAGKFNELLAFALSDRGLPKKAGAAEIKEITIQRTQFAFKAALKENRLLDTCKLAFKAAEEMAGTERVDELLNRNSAFVASCLSSTATQELALSRKFSAGWTGSSNIYTALLLSAHADFRGQALSFLRSSRRWIDSFSEKLKKQPPNAEIGFHQEASFQLDELAAMAGAILNLEGIEKTVEFLIRWQPAECAYEITARLVESLIDMGRISDVLELLRRAREEPYVVIGCCEQLIAVCIVPEGEPLEFTLRFLSDSPELIEMPKMRSLNDGHRHLPIVAFCEAVASNNLDQEQLLKILHKICEHAELRHFSHYESEPRKTFFRVHSLRMTLHGQRNFEDTETWKQISKRTESPNSYRQDDLPRLFGRHLFPWFLRRAQTLVADQAVLCKQANIPYTPTAGELTHEGHEAHLIGYEVSCVWGEVLGFSRDVSESEFSQFREKLLTTPGERLRMSDTIHLAQIIYRHRHLSALGEGIEEFFNRFIRVIDGEPGEESFDYQASFAKAIYPVSKSDARAHFGRAIEATSKFGHELNERWRAIVEVATRAASEGEASANLCQRYFRCAEVVAEGVAREKYWDRCETFAVGLELNPTVALAAWSRWRDRRLTSYRPTLLSMARRAVKKEILPPSTAWPLTAFLECNASAELHAECIAAESNPSIREAMKNCALRDLRLAGVSRSGFETISHVVGDLPELAMVEATPEKFTAAGASESSPSFDSRDLDFNIHVSRLLENCDIATTEGLRRILKGAQDMPGIRYQEQFWPRIVAAIPRDQREQFLENLLALNEFDLHDLINLSRAVEHWKKSASIQDRWPSFLEEMGARFPENVFSLGSREYHVEGGRISAAEYDYLQKGVITAFSETSRIHQGTVFLGFVTQCVDRLEENEACELLDFSLGRMELHIPDGFGEGHVNIQEDSLSPVSGILWSALGSPYATERWQAMHAVRRLSATENLREITHLIERMKSGVVGIYGCAKYDFFLLHAQLYLLTALNRVAADNGEKLKDHFITFQTLALSEPAHLLIQRTASEICLKIAQSDPSSLTSDQLQILRGIGNSPYPLEKEKDRTGFKDAPWASPEDPDPNRQIYFDNDFGWHWFPQLRTLFGVGQKHIEYLAKRFIETFLGKPQDSNFGWLRDSRSHSQSSHRSRSENFQHSHGSYPSADSLSFYCKYHSFLHVSARLLESTPVIEDHPSWHREKDPLNSWLQRHILTLEDGSWLCDRRDPAPQQRRKWSTEYQNNEWKNSVADDEFEEILNVSMGRENWVVLHGSWTDCHNGAVETLRVKSTLVDPSVSDALGRFLSSQGSPYDFDFPRCSEEESTGDEIPFVLHGMILESPDDSIGLSTFDPYAGHLPYPPLAIGRELEDALGIKPDLYSREWRKVDSGRLVMISEIWNQEGDETHTIYPSGRRIGADLSLLTELCGGKNMDLVFCVEIHRHFEHGSSRHFGEDKDDRGRGMHFKIFILSINGIIREIFENDRTGA